MKIGYIGLGIMGKPMAKNLIKAGHELIVTDHHEENIQEMLSCGAKRGASNSEIAKECEIIVTMLPNSPHVKEVVCGENGILETAKPGTIIIDNSSIAQTVSQEIYAECKKKDVHYIDAPVSGGEPGAINGTLAIMVGGDEEIFNKVKDDVLLKMGSSAVYCGNVGAGNTTKLANNIIVALNISAVAEAFTMATKAGVDPEKVFNAIKGGLAGSNVLNQKMPMMLEGNRNPGFKIDLHIKDLKNALDTAHEIGSPLPMTSQVMEVLQYLKSNDLGNADHSAIAMYYEMLNGGTSLVKE